MDGLRIRPGKSLKLRKVSPEAPHGLSKDDIERRTDRYGRELAELEDLLYYAGQHGVLIVLQGRDTAGKDGTIRKILDYCNVQSSRVESFKVPTDAELAHDFLWRVHARTPARGELVIFNRSHYEDVLVVRVHDLVEKAVWKRRYDDINAFERLLVDSRTIVFKFFLHIDRDEQRARLLEREEEREKAWKLSVGDWKEREYWDAYTEAYEDALSRCSTKQAPWHVVPANQKWYRNYVVLKTIVDGLTPYRKGWLAHLGDVGRARLAEIHAYRGEADARSR
jgi:PPK2 family polyphosphate:nucleotide phosphotransferase